MTTEYDKLTERINLLKNYKYTDAYTINDNLIKLNNILTISTPIQKAIQKNNEEFNLYNYKNVIIKIINNKLYKTDYINLFNNINNINSIIFDNNNNCISFIIDGSINTNYNTINTITITNNIFFHMYSSIDSTINIKNLLNLKILNISSNSLFLEKKIIFDQINNLQILNLNNNDIDNINTISLNVLSNLKVLNLSHNNIINITSDSFNGLLNLKNLNLSYNRINEINYDSFNSLINLKNLNLSYNNLVSLSNLNLANLLQLQILNLSNNSLQRIDMDNVNKFDNLINLHTLNLNNNEIKNYPLLFEPLIKTLPKLFDLQINNPLLINKFNIILNKIRSENQNIISYINNEECIKCINKETECVHTRQIFINKCLPFYNLLNSKINVLNYNATSYIYYNSNNNETYYLNKNFYLNKLLNYTSIIDNYDYDLNNLLLKITYTTFNNIPIYFLFNDYNIIFNIFIYQIKNITNTYKNYIQNNNKKIIKINKQIDDYINQNKDMILCNETIKILQDNIILIDSQIKALKNSILTKEQKYEKKNDLVKEQFKYIQLKNEQNQKLIEIINNNKYILDYKSLIKNLEDKNNNKITKINLFDTFLNNLFRSDVNNKFISISYKFNILNISLLCEKYKELIDLICLNINSKEYNQSTIKVDIIKKELKTIFEDFNLSNIYYLITKYKTNLQGIPHHLADINLADNNKTDILNIKYIDTDTIFNNIKNNKKKNDNKTKNIKTYYNEYNTIITQESNLNKIDKIIIDKTNITDYIYTLLSVEIILIIRILNSITKYLPEFKNLFFMAILSFKFKNITLNGTWGFNKQYIYYLINNNIKNIKFKSRDEYSEYTQKCINYFSINNKPIIYENDWITYKDVSYGNCMENVILQFLKIIFWNNITNEYDESIIHNIINIKYLDIILEFFKNINNEKNSEFILGWVEFITELAPETYDFIKADNKVELNSTINNLIIVLRILTHDTLSKPNDIDFIKYIIKTANNQYTINININQSTQINDKLVTHDNLLLNTNINKNYNIELYHSFHGRIIKINTEKTLFKDLFYTIESSELSSFESSFESIYNSHKNNPIKINNLNTYIYYSYANNTNNNYFKNYIINYIDKNEIIKLFNSFTKTDFINNAPINIQENIINNYQEIIELLPFDVFINNYTIDFDNTMLKIIIEQNLLNKFDKTFTSISNFIINISKLDNIIDKIKIDYINIIIQNVLLKYLHDIEINDIEMNKNWMYLIQNNKLILNCIMSNQSIKKYIPEFTNKYIILYTILNNSNLNDEDKNKAIIDLNIDMLFFENLFLYIDKITNCYTILINNYINIWNDTIWYNFLIKNNLDIIYSTDLFSSINEYSTSIINNIILKYNEISDINYEILDISLISVVNIILNCEKFILNLNFYRLILLDEFKIILKSLINDYLSNFINVNDDHIEQIDTIDRINTMRNINKRYSNKLLESFNTLPITDRQLYYKLKLSIQLLFM